MKTRAASILLLIATTFITISTSTVNEDVSRGVRAPSCWTCPPGFAHWWVLGKSAPTNGDQCQCLPGTAPAPAPAVPNCWTCPPGFKHWWELGAARPADQCACLPVSTPNAPATPVSTPSCWTCPSGYKHWWELGKSAPTNGDKCQCLPSGTAPAPAPATANTPAPSSCWTCPAGYSHWWVLGRSAPTNGDKCQCLPGTAQAPAPATPVSTPSCWTCPSGYKHWWELGLPQPADKCACVLAGTSTSSTSAPISKPTGCWACPAGYKHWFDVGFSAPTNGDRCQCIPTSDTPSTPVSTPSCWTCPSGYSHWWELGLSNPTNGDKCECLVNSAPVAPQTAEMKRFLDAMTPTATSPGSISFSPIVAPYAPWNLPPYTLMDSLLGNIVKTTNFRVVMVYGLTLNQAALARKYGVKVLGIINLINDGWTNGKAITEGIQAAKQYSDVVLALSCGNEFGLAYGTGSNSAAIINGCISQVKNSGVKQPVGVIDIYNSWNQNGARWSAVADNADWIGVNTYPWYDNIYAKPPFTCATPDNAGGHTLLSLTRLENLYKPKPVVLTEYGWPSSPAGSVTINPPNVYTHQSCTQGSDWDQRKAVQNILNVMRQHKKPCNLFSGYREAWKGSSSSSVEEFWGVCSGTPPYSCYNAPK